MAVDRCLATILAREACLRKGRMTMEELCKQKRKLEVERRPCCQLGGRAVAPDRRLHSGVAAG